MKYCTDCKFAYLFSWCKREDTKERNQFTGVKDETVLNRSSNTNGKCEYFQHKRIWWKFRRPN